MSELRSIIRGVGSYLPARILSNEELSKTIDTSDEWIQQRVGIKQRHIAADGEYTSDLAVHAARRALDNARLSPDDIDVPEIGHELAAARALRNLGTRLLATTSADIEGMTDEPVCLEH